MTPLQREFVKGLTSHDWHAPYRMFEWFCEMAFCALAKPMADPERGAALEARYLRCVESLKPAIVTRFSEMLGMVAVEIHETEADFFGAVVGSDEVNALNKGAGQFFTPSEVCRLMAKMTIHGAKDLLDHQPYLTIGEPACGSGAMILAAIAELRDQGVDVARSVWVDATDISSLCVQMTFIQMTCAGVPGVVHCDDTLFPRAQAEAWLTAPSVDFLARHGWPRVQTIHESGEPVSDNPMQPSLFLA